MAIAFNCSCGRKINAKDEHAGKRVKCPGCQQPITVPSAAAAPAMAAASVKASGSRMNPAPARQASVPDDDDMYGMQDDAPPPAKKSGRGEDSAAASPWGDDDPGLDAPIAAPRPYMPGAGSSPAAPSRGKTAPSAAASGSPAAGGLGTFAALGSKRGAVQPPKGSEATGGLHLGGFAKLLIAAAILLPTLFFVIKQGPVKAVAEWNKTEPQGDNDTHTVLARVIHDMDVATMAPPDPNEEPDGIPYHPMVSHFYYPDPPFVMWTMPQKVDVQGNTTFGPYKGFYHTRKRLVECEMEWKGGKQLQVVGQLAPDGNVERVTVDGIESSDVMAIAKKFDGYHAWKDELEQEKSKLKGAGAGVIRK